MLSAPPVNCEASAPARVEPSVQSKGLLGSPVVLLVLLGFLLLFIGLLSSWGIKRVGEDYSKLITQTALDLDRLHDISYHTGIGFATTLQLPVTVDPSKRAAMLRTIADERWSNDAVFGELVRKAGDARLRSALDDVLVKRAIFTNRTDEFILDLSRLPADAKANANSTPVLDSFVQYQKSCDRLADLVRSMSMQASSRLTNDAGKFRLLFFAAGALPIILGTLGILLTFYFVWVTPPEADFKE